MITAILLILAGLVLPIGYLSLCIFLRRHQTWWFTYLAYFFLFGTFGGWLLALALSPSGLAALCIIYLVTFALVACIASSLILTFKKEKHLADRIAMTGGFLYPACLAIMFCVGLILK